MAGNLNLKAECMKDETEWLEEQSMLYRSALLAEKYSGRNIQWQYPYGFSQPEKVVEIASVWFTAYPVSTITPPGKTVLQILGDEKLWSIFQQIGIQAVHTGAMKIAGGAKRKKYTPSEEGGFERPGYDIDPLFGTQAQYLQMESVAKAYGGVIAGDLIPGHTGRGADFQLAMKNYKDYPGIYHMIKIEEKDWDLLPKVPKGRTSINLPLKVLLKLRKMGYISSRLERVIFFDQNAKETNWDATEVVSGADGKKRRWIYLHYFKANQPALNWLDPSFAAGRLLSGDIMVSIGMLKDKILRLDTNGFLGVEIIPGAKRAFSQGHPLSLNVSASLAMMTRKLGGFTFQELNLNLAQIKNFSISGPDLTYDFLCRTACLHAFLHQDASFLRLTYQLMQTYELQPVRFLHALQNHDEFNYELVHFRDHPDEEYEFQGDRVTAERLREKIRKKDTELLTGKAARYNLNSKNGPCSTIAGLIAASLGYRNLSNLSNEEKEKIKNAHLLLAFFNCMQPGVFAISGWDLVGALPLPADWVKEEMKDGDHRWINRGAYDLLCMAPAVRYSQAGLLKADSLYGPLNLQIKNPCSFINQLQKMIQIRKKYNIDIARLHCVPEVKNKGLFIAVHILPGTGYYQLTAVNFERKPVKEIIEMEEFAGKSAINLHTRKREGKDLQSQQFLLEMEPLQGKVFVFQPSKYTGK